MNAVKDLVEIGIDGEYDGDICPECGKVHVPNAETLAAMEEGDAMLRGEIPSKTFHSLEELLEDLRN